MTDLLVQITTAIAEGRTLDEVDEQVIQPAALSDDHKAALWLYAWSFMDSGKQRSLALSHIQLVTN